MSKRQNKLIAHNVAHTHIPLYSLQLCPIHTADAMSRVGGVYWALEERICHRCAAE